jgi:hypothetical protein
MRHETALYALRDGSGVTKVQIAEAVKAGSARLVHSIGDEDGRSSAGLMLDGVDIDTRGKLGSSWAEEWTTVPTEQEALYCARNVWPWPGDE